MKVSMTARIAFIIVHSFVICFAQNPKEDLAKKAQEAARAAKIQKDLSEDLKKKAQEEIQKALKKALEKFKKITINDLWNAFGFPKFQREIVEKSRSAWGQTVNVQQGVKLDSSHNLDPVVTKEGQFVSKRLPRIKTKLEQLANTKFNKDSEIPHLGLSFSGGGYRALILTAGYLKAFEDLGIFDSALYMTGLSGSTWFQGPFIYNQKPDQNKQVTINQYYQMLSNKIRSDEFNPFNQKNTKNFNTNQFVWDILLPKLSFNQNINSVDIYGSVLANTLLSSFGDQRQQQRLSYQASYVKNGAVPWPIYTAISMHRLDSEYRYNWYEFNPEEVRNLELNIAIPSFAFGRKFNAGVSQDFAPEQSFGFLMGIFGSAYSLNLKDLQRIFTGDIVQGQQEAEAASLGQVVEWAEQGDFDKILKSINDTVSFSKIKEALIAKIWDILSTIPDTRIGTLRAIPSQINNPFKDLFKNTRYTAISGIDWLTGRDTLTFIDAGIDYNIPVRPLFRPERKLDVLFIGDASSDADTGGELRKALNDIKRVHDITYSRDATLSDKTVMVYRPDTQHKLAPVILYANFLKDDALFAKIKKDHDDAEQEWYDFWNMLAEKNINVSTLANKQLKDLIQANDQRLQTIIQETHDLLRIIDANNLHDFDVATCSYCGTFNFNYTEEQFKQLTAIAEFNIKAHKDIYLQIINERIDVLKQEPNDGSWGFR